MSCMCSVYQKYYNSLLQLDKVNIKNNLFENITYLDSFFSEFRNITFMIQSNCRNQEAKEIYSELRQKYLLNSKMKWFIEKRDEIIHQNPIDLKKRIEVSIYTLTGEKNIIDKIITIKDDNITLENITENIVENLKHVETVPEVFLSAKFMMFDENDELDICEVIRFGVQVMHDFISEFDEKIANKCDTCQKLMRKTLNLIQSFVSKQISLIEDMSFNTKSKELIFYDKAQLLFGSKNGNIIKPLDKKIEKNSKGMFMSGNTFFEKYDSFVLFHIFIARMQSELMSVYVILYEDSSYEFQPFIIFVKSTMYRIIADLCKKILKDKKIVAIFFMNEMFMYQKKDFSKINKMSSEERRNNLIKKECINFYAINSDLLSRINCFDKEKIHDDKYIQQQIIKNTEVEDFTFYHLAIAFQTRAQEIAKNK